MTRPAVAVVVATRDRPHLLPDCVRALASAGRALVVERYHWPVLADRFAEDVLGLVG